MESNVLRHIRSLLAGMDKTMLGLNLFLVTAGCIFIYGAGQEVGGVFARLWRQQILGICVGGACYLAIAAIDYRRLGEWSWGLYLLGILLLVLVFTPLGKVINGARSWLFMPGVSAIRLQPAEVAKPATAFFAAWVAGRTAVRNAGIPIFIPVGLIVLPPVLLVMLQPDFGTALVFIPLMLSIVFVGGVPLRWVAAGLLAVAVVIPVAYPRLQDHQKDRIKVFLEPPADAVLAPVEAVLPPDWQETVRERKDVFFKRSRRAVDTDWNAHQSLLAVGSGGMWGKGFMHGTQHVLGFLPRTVAPTDFIFSVVAEEMGFAGAAAVICAYAGLILCCLRTAGAAADPTGKILASAVAVVFLTHIVINVGMTVQAAPIIGIPLPFLSYGGSFAIGTLIFAGLVQSVHIHGRADEEDAG